MSIKSNLITQLHIKSAKLREILLDRHGVSYLRDQSYLSALKNNIYIQIKKKNRQKHTLTDNFRPQTSEA
jgi:hypothetical protein